MLHIHDAPQTHAMPRPPNLAGKFARSAMTDTDGTSDLLARFDRELWILTVSFLIIGDLVTTGLGVSSGQIAEVGPLGDPIVEQYGMYGMVALKLGVLGLSFVAWKLAPDPERIGIPLGLAAIGVVVTLWNTVVLSLARW
jgi:hypothetical protein